MVSEQSRQAVNAIFSRAAKANLALDTSDRVEIDQLHVSMLGDAPGKDIVVLTISSYLFRLLTIFHVNPGTAIEGYFMKAESGREFHEVFGEHGNLCVGAMNRDLGKHFLHLGMSTPYTLESKCISFITALKPSYVSHHRIGINAEISLHATLCLCAYAPLDFGVAADSIIEEAGELELF